MNILILFHSVTANTYFLAQEFKKNFDKLGLNAELKRVKDEDLFDLSKTFPEIAENFDKINSVPVASINDLIQADLILFGSPTYYGNMSAEMKAFMDNSVQFFSQEPLKTKKCAFFTSSGSAQGGGVYCLEAMIRFAQHNAMIPISVPNSIQTLSSEISAYGICHTMGKISDDLKTGISEFSKYMLTL